MTGGVFFTYIVFIFGTMKTKQQKFEDELSLYDLLIVFLVEPFCV